MSTATSPRPGPASWGDRVRDLWRPTAADRGRLIACVLIALLASIVTGKDGSGDHPLHGINWSLTHHGLYYAIGGVVLWVGAVLGRSLAPAMRGARSQVSSVTDRALRPRWARPLLYLVLLGIAIWYPRTISAAGQQSLVNDVAIYALLGLGLNVVVGFAGLLDLGYIAFYAIGAYTTAYFTSKTAIPWHAPFVWNPFFIFPIAVIVAALAGVLLGGPTLRLRGDYLAIVTLGFGEIVYLLANNEKGITNGASGAFGVPQLSIHLGSFKYKWGLASLPYYYLLLGIIVVVMMAFSALNRSRTGRALAAIREDEVAAEAMGVPTLKYKLIAFAIGASVSGFAGVIFATEQFFDPSSFTFQASILVLTIVIFGGMGSVFGVVLGAIVLQGLLYNLKDTVPPNDRYIYFGAVIMLMMVFRPQGLLPSRRRSRELALSEAGIGHADATMSGSAS
ncbi:MAG TPA: branched-chain amino acid ABC transporter permease [Frankiaceae bacterium]|jgi:branched-chain amino acid transport system permease protein|nr:branched-chain amino acid ABC transporter permease [Frankiaceae bacterium]